MGANQTYREKAWRHLHNNAASNFEQYWGQHPTKHQLYGHVPPITKTIKARRTRHVGLCSYVMFSYGTLHMAEQKQDDQLEPT